MARFPSTSTHMSTLIDFDTSDLVLLAALPTLAPTSDASPEVEPTTSPNCWPQALLARHCLQVAGPHARRRWLGTSTCFTKTALSPPHRAGVRPQPARSCGRWRVISHRRSAGSAGIAGTTPCKCPTPFNIHS